MTDVITGTKIGWTNREYIMVVFNTEDPKHAALAVLKYSCLSFMQTIGYTFP